MKTLLSAASVCALLIAAPAWAQNSTTQTSTTQATAAAQGLSQQDKSFVQHAGDGSLAEADMGKLALQKGATPAVREFGRWMYTDHGLVANNWLKAILADQNESVQPKLTAEDQQLHQRLEGLSGARFDREYMQSQVADHEKTIPTFQQEARDGQNQMIKTFAANLIPVLEQHLAEARALAGGAGMAAGAELSAAERSGSSTPPR